MGGVRVPLQATLQETSMNADTVHQATPDLRKTARNLCTFVAALILTAAGCFLLGAM